MIVLDSSFLVAYYNTRDSQHAGAVALMERYKHSEWGRGLLLEYVFLEVTTVLMARTDLPTAIRVGRLLLAAEDMDFVPCSGLFTETFDAFTGQSGTRLSFTDCAIAHAASERAGGLVLTFDRELGRFPGLTAPPAG